jgi:hypothetical protein
MSYSWRSKAKVNHVMSAFWRPVSMVRGVKRGREGAIALNRESTGDGRNRASEVTAAAWHLDAWRAEKRASAFSWRPDSELSGRRSAMLYGVIKGYRASAK